MSTGTPGAPERRRLAIVAELDVRQSVDVVRSVHERDSSIDVLIAGNPQTTRRLMESYDVDAVAVLVDPAQPTGLVSLRRIGMSFPDTRIVAVTKTLARGRESHLYVNGADRVLARRDPMAVGDALAEALSWAKTLSGDLSGLGAADVIQALCLARRSVMLRLTSTKERGVVWVDGGQIRHAVCNELVGSDALGEALRMTDGSFVGISGVELPEVTITSSWESAMLDSSRRSDEEHRGDESVEWPFDSGLNRLAEASRPGVPPQVASAVTPIAWTTPRKHIVPSENPDYAELTALGLQCMQEGNMLAARKYWDAARLKASDTTQELESTAS